MKFKDIITKVAEDNNIPADIVSKAYKAYWMYIRNSVQNIPLKEELTEAEFSLLKPNFNIPSLGKLYVTYDKYKGVKKRFNYIKLLRKRNENIKED